MSKVVLHKCFSILNIIQLLEIFLILKGIQFHIRLEEFYFLIKSVKNQIHKFTILNNAIYLSIQYRLHEVVTSARSGSADRT